VHQTAQVPTPEADVAVPPPPQQEEAGAQPLEQADAQPREPWTTRQYALGCLGAFFVVFVVGAFVSALAGNEGGGNEAQKNKKGGGGKDTAPKPELVVSSPSGSPTVTSDSIEVKGEVTPATSKVTVNGEGVTPDDGSFSTPLHLNVGENYIQISAEKGSEQADASRTVTRKLPEKETAAQEAPQVQNSEQQPQAEKKPSPQAEYSVGQTAQVANVQWRVSDAYLTNQLRSNFGTQKRGRFVVVNFTFTNNRDEEV
jgi:Glucodextranase, domain B